MLTGDAEVIARGIFVRPSSLHDLAMEANAAIMDCVQRKWLNMSPPLNIIMIDFYNETPLTSLCILINQGLSNADSHQRLIATQ